MYMDFKLDFLLKYVNVFLKNDKISQFFSVFPLAFMLRKAFPSLRSDSP